jgi:two-component system OmpR family response regulator
MPRNAERSVSMGAAKAAGPRVLLIEDDLDLASILADALQARGYRVSHVATAAEAERLVDRMRPDLIILDLILPDRNGLVLCDSLKERTGAPIIIASGSRRIGDPELGARLGATAFIAKPFALDDLETRMDAALQARRGPP